MASRPKRLDKYQKGDVFLVPLPDGSMVRGVVARFGPKRRIVLGYFFGPKFTPGAKIEVDDLSKDSAIYIARFGDLGLIRGEWPVVGRVPDWKDADWPMPLFVHEDLLRPGVRELIRYADDDPSSTIELLPYTGPGYFPEDGVAGYGYVEQKLGMILQAIAKGSAYSPQSRNRAPGSG